MYNIFLCVMYYKYSQFSTMDILVLSPLFDFGSVCVMRHSQELYGVRSSLQLSGRSLPGALGTLMNTVDWEWIKPFNSSSYHIAFSRNQPTAFSHYPEATKSPSTDGCTLGCKPLRARMTRRSLLYLLRVIREADS